MLGGVENAKAWSPSARWGSVMYGTTPKVPRCLNCDRPMQLFRTTSRYGEVPDLYSFCCVACDEWHVEKATPHLIPARSTAHKM
jgi:hypothetical protein